MHLIPRVLVVAAMATLLTSGAYAGEETPSSEAAPADFSEVLARRLLPEAAGADVKRMAAAIELGYRVPPPNNARLSMVASLWHHIAPPGAARDLDLRALGGTPEQAVIDSLRKQADAANRAWASILDAGQLLRVTAQQSGDTASGRAWFKSPEADASADRRAGYDGQVDYTAKRDAQGAWSIVAFRFPETGVMVRRDGKAWRLQPARLVIRTRVEPPPQIEAPVIPAALDRPARSVRRGDNAALNWLAAHQSPNGGWEAAGFGSWCDLSPAPTRRPEGQGKASYDVGVTGLATLAFLTAGYTNRGNHPYAKTVSRALRYLKNVQDPEGCFGPRSSQQYIYNHALAMSAMVEAYAMTSSPIFKTPAQRALDFAELARNPYFAWRYGIKPGENDTSVTGSMFLSFVTARKVNEAALQRGQTPPLRVEGHTTQGVIEWLDKVTDRDYGRVGYLTRGTGSARPQELLDRFPSERSRAMTAIGVALRSYTQTGARDASLIGKGLDLMAQRLPNWDPTSGDIDMYYWYWGTIAHRAAKAAHGSERHWMAWRTAALAALKTGQRRDGTPCTTLGSWDPVGPWGPDGGRVYSTAMLSIVQSLCGAK